MKHILRITSMLFIGLLMACQQEAPQDISNTEDAPITRIFMVRHAEKELDAGKDPNLTEEGKARAERLKLLLGEAGVTQVYSSKFARTMQTAQPLAEYLKVEVQLYDHKNMAVIEQIAKQHLGETILIVGHSNTVPPMANVLLQERRYESLDESVYNKVFVLTQQGKNTDAYLLQY